MFALDLIWINNGSLQEIQYVHFCIKLPNGKITTIDRWLWFCFRFQFLQRFIAFEFSRNNFCFLSDWIFCERSIVLFGWFDTSHCINIHIYYCVEMNKNACGKVKNSFLFANSHSCTNSSGSSSSSGCSSSIIAEIKNLIICSFRIDSLHRETTKNMQFNIKMYKNEIIGLSFNFLLFRFADQSCCFEWSTYVFFCLLSNQPVYGKYITSIATFAKIDENFQMEIVQKYIRSIIFAGIKTFAFFSSQ